MNIEHGTVLEQLLEANTKALKKNNKLLEQMLQVQERIERLLFKISL